MIFETYLAIKASSSPEKRGRGESEKGMFICILERTLEDVLER